MANSSPQDQSLENELDTGLTVMIRLLELARGFPHRPTQDQIINIALERAESLRARVHVVNHSNRNITRPTSEEVRQIVDERMASFRTCIREEVRHAVQELSHCVGGSNVEDFDRSQTLSEADSPGPNTECSRNPIEQALNEDLDPPDTSDDERSSEASRRSSIKMVLKRVRSPTTPPEGGESSRDEHSEHERAVKRSKSGEENIQEMFPALASTLAGASTGHSSRSNQSQVSSTEFVEPGHGSTSNAPNAKDSGVRCVPIDKLMDGSPNTIDAASRVTTTSETLPLTIASTSSLKEKVHEPHKQRKSDCTAERDYEEDRSQDSKGKVMCPICRRRRESLVGFRCNSCKAFWQRLAGGKMQLPTCNHSRRTSQDFCRGCRRRRYETSFLDHRPGRRLRVPPITERGKRRNARVDHFD